MIYCPHCGKGIPDQSKFCTFCGTAIAANQSVSDIPPQPVVNPTPPPVQQQYVNPAPAQQFVRPQPVTSKNEFYKNAGFWGAILTVIGFFLPYVNGYDVSFYYLVTDLAPDKPELYMYLIFPISGAILILQGLTGALPRFLVAIFKLLPILMLALFAAGISQNSSSFGFMGSDVGSILSNIGVGLYMTVIGSILMLFFRTTKVKV